MQNKPEALENQAYWQRWAEWVMDQPDAPEKVRAEATRLLDHIATFEAEQEAANG